MPRRRADALREIVPGVRHWNVDDDRIGFRSEAYAVDDRDGCVAIDPLPLTAAARDALGAVAAIVLTVAAHQRAAWELRERTGARVVVPAGSVGLEGSPDGSYAAGEALAGGLVAVRAPGPKGAHLVLRLDDRGGRVVLFTGDLLLRVADGPPTLLPVEHLADPEAARRTARDLARSRPAVLCLGHGAPVTRGASRALLDAARR